MKVTKNQKGANGLERICDQLGQDESIMVEQDKNERME